jgi:hypothetical protein
MQADFQRIAKAVLKELMATKREGVYASLDDLIATWKDYAAQLERGDLSAASEMRIDFMPTSELQDAAIDGGWGDQFLTIAKDFDLCYAAWKIPDVQRSAPAREPSPAPEFEQKGSALTNVRGYFESTGLKNFVDIAVYPDHVYYHIEAMPQFHDSTTEEYTQSIADFRGHGPLIPLDFLSAEEKAELEKAVALCD